jgi:hypothetical protein
MKKNLSVIFLCFLAGLFGANVTPLLTGTGKLVFPETSPSANLSASSGKLSVAAGGTNQNILIAPSGTGSVGVNVTDPTFGGLQASPGLSIGGYGTPLVIGNTLSTVNFKIGLNGSGEWALYDYGAAAWTLGMFQTHGRVGITLSPGAGNQLDVGGLGTINASSGYLTNNVAGLSVVKTIAKTSTTSCTMTFSGGILTASTC